MKQIGTRIRKIRLRQQRTLQELAENCGYTRSLLSKIENGKTMPPLTTLAKIATALGVKTSVLLDDEGGGGTVFQAARDLDPEGFVRTDCGYSFFTFASERQDRLFQPFLFVARKGELGKHQLSHAGEEFVYVLEGRMRYRVGDITYELSEGDSLYFDSAEEHALEPLTDEVKYLGIFADSAKDEQETKTKRNGR